MNLILASVGLPPALLEEFWADADTTLSEYSVLLQKGVSSSIEVIDACSAYVECRSKEDPTFLPEREVLCVEKSEGEQSLCAEKLNRPFSLEIDLRPCDCTLGWDEEMLLESCIGEGD